MATKTSFHDDLKEKAWLRSGKLLIACGVAAILCWLFIQSAQSSAVLEKTQEIPNAENLSGPDPDVLAQLSGVVITKTHLANFTVGQPGGTFQIQIRNTNAISLTGALTVTDDLPAGLTLASFDGIGFTCGP
ncbi:MAG TPA: hypothetical protein VLD65_03025, partial [Anaerolineales bacterium]|nr:hypothetical protein [Anaerolineales bacterium]